MTGTTAYYVHLLQGDDLDADLARLDEIGGPTTTPHYPRGWAMAGNTPFRLYKINTHAGGHSVPCIVSWPAAASTMPARSAASTSTSPTCCRRCSTAAASTMPTERNGRVLADPAGSSFAAALTDAGAPSTHTSSTTRSSATVGTTATVGRSSRCTSR